MDPAIAFPLMLMPFVVVIALLSWNLSVTRRAVREGEPATWTRPRPVPPASAAFLAEEAPVTADALSGDDEASLAAMRADLERRREELERQSAAIAEKEARLAQRD